MHASSARAAASRQDFDALQTLALEPGGLGDDSVRQQVWPVLLHSRGTSKAKETACDTTEELQHPDARQIQLDVDRSFVTPGWLPTPHSPEDLQKLRQRLAAVLCHLFARHPALRYFQGLHDVASVLLLVLSEQDQKDASAKEAMVQLALHALRDHLTPSLEPSLGYLRLTMAVLQKSDPKLADMVRMESPLPFFSLSWVITWMSHDIESLPAIKRLFDVLLVMNPAFISYIAAALTLYQAKGLNMKTIEAGELQHHLSQLPRIRLSTRSPDSSNSESDLEIPSDMSTSFLTSASSSDHQRQHQPEQDATASKSERLLDFEELLSRAHELWRRHPLPDVGAYKDIFDVKSVVSTWRLQERIVNDSEAEHIVEAAVDIVKPEPIVPPSLPIHKRSAVWKHLLRLARSSRTYGPTIVLFGAAVAGVVLALYGPRLGDLMQHKSPTVRSWSSWLHLLQAKFRAGSLPTSVSSFHRFW